jgi:hypothetical protein
MPKILNFAQLLPNISTSVTVLEKIFNFAIVILKNLSFPTLMPKFYFICHSYSRYFLKT